MPTAKSGDLVSMTVAAGATVSLSGVSPIPTISGTGTTRTFVVPIVSAANTTIVITVNGSPTNLDITPTKLRTYWSGAWVAAYKVVGPYSNAVDVSLNLVAGSSGLSLTGSGTLTGTGKPTAAVSVGLTGSGTLTGAAAAGTQTYPSATTYPGSTVYPIAGSNSPSYNSSVTLSGVGSLSLSGSAQLGTKVINSNVESATISSPISREDMWAFIGANYGSYSNFTNTSVVSTDGVGGTTTKVIDQNFPTNNNSNYGAPSTGTGITLTSTPLAGGAVDEATIEFDFRAKASGVPWGWGGKIPGLGGLKPGASGGVPTGGQPSPNGWSARCMFRRIGTAADANLQANLVGYFYSPNLPAGAIGNDLSTGKTLVANTWHHIKQYHKMNTVTTEGSTSPPADGIHRIWLDGVLCYESTSTVYRFYQTANITHLVWDNFYGGNDVTDGKPWGPVVDTHHQFDNFVVTTF